MSRLWRQRSTENVQIGTVAQSEKMRQERSNVIRGAVVVGILFALALMVDAIWFSDATLHRNGPKPKPAQVSYVSQMGSLERTVEEIALAVLGKTVNWEGRPHTIMAIDNIRWHEGGRLIVIKFRANENLTSGLVKIGILNDALDLNEAVFTNPKCQPAGQPAYACATYAP